MKLRCPVKPDLTVSVTFFASRVAETIQPASARGRPATVARIFAPQVASGCGASAETGSASFTVALPGWQTSSHISHSAAAERSTVAPGLRSAGAVRVTGRNSSPS